MRSLAESCQILPDPDPRGPAPCRRPCALLAPWVSPAPFFCFFGAPKPPKMNFFLILFSDRFLDRFSTRFGFLLGSPHGSKIHSLGSFFESFVLALIWHRFFMFFGEVFDWSFFCRERFYLVIYEVFLHFHFCGRSRHLPFARRFFTRFRVPKWIIFGVFSHVDWPPNFGLFF